MSLLASPLNTSLLPAMFAKSLSLAALAAAASAAPPRGPPSYHKPGFVTTDGTKFSLDGKDFFFAGSNAYYLPFLNVSYLYSICFSPAHI